QRVDLGFAGGLGLDVGGEIALAARPLARGHGVAAAIFLAFEGADALTARALFHHGLNEDAVHFHTGFGLDGAFEGLVGRAHVKPPYRPVGLFFAIGTRISGLYR